MIEEYRDEHKAIQLAAAKFGLFMKENSILPYNDETVAYLDMMIEAEQAKVDAGGGDKKKNTLQALKEDKQEHLELVSVLEKSMQGRGSSKAVDQAEVNLLVNRLFSLKHFGKNLTDLQTDIAYTHARTNRENPHRVKARNAVRRGGHGFGYRQASNNSIRMPFSDGSQGRTQSDLVKRQSVMRPGFSTGTMRTSQQQQTESAWSMPGSFNGPATQMAVRTSPSSLKQPPILKKTWGLSSFNPFR